MPIQVIDRTLMVSDRCRHQARSVGDQQWVVSFLPGRTLSTEQAAAAMQIAESVADNLILAQHLGLTVLEACGLAAKEPPPDDESAVTTRRTFRRLGRRAMRRSA
ncbi:hypothetical protein [Nocardia sp. NPDC019395]|uniref:hypothetical protein n=1 Tax=Nocardia sp. NPDC019395 TaxID=3154686 RepID=UPI0033E8E74E